MKKLSQINETSWGGMVRRSSSNVVRKQDELDAMPLEDFKDYLETIYEPIKEGINISLQHPDSEMNMYILVPYYENVMGDARCFYYNGKSIWTFDFEGRGAITQRLKDKFDIEIDKKKLTQVSLGGEVSNSLFIHVIDFLLNIVKTPALKRKVNETSWGGMVRRSSSEVKRKEDDVNLMGIEDFKGWLKDRYKILDKYGASIFSSKTDYGYISFPLFVNGYKLYSSSISYNEDGSVRKIYIFATEKDCGKLIDVLREKFDIYVNVGVEVKDKNGKLSNSVFVDLIETVLENSEIKLYDKVK